jgi:O-antigen/teichoic acid export membrane protein
VPSIAVFASYSVMVSYLGAEMFGVLLIAQSISSFVAISDIGITQSTIKFVAADLSLKNHKSAADVIVTNFALFAVVGSAMATGICLASDSIAGLFDIPATLARETVVVFRIAAIQVVVLLLINVVLSVFKALNRFDLYAISTSSMAILVYGAVIIVVMSGGSIVTAMKVSLFAHLLMLGLLFELMQLVGRRQGLLCSQGRFGWPCLKRMVPFGSFIAVHALFALTLNHGIRVLIGALFSLSDVTVFALANSVVGKIMELVNAGTEFLFPMIAGTKNRSFARKIYFKSIAAGSFFAITACLGIFFFGETIIDIWLQSEISSEVFTFTMLMAPSFIFRVWAPVGYHIVNGFGRPAITLVPDVVNMTLFVSIFSYTTLVGMSISSFAIAYSSMFVISTIAYIVAIERYVWRREL